MNILINRFQSAFDEIRAEESLKDMTKEYLKKEIQKRSTKKNHILFKRYSMMFASVVLFFLVGLSSYYFYFTPNAYIDFDVNPSVEIVLNRFEKVIDSYAYNTEGEMILQKADIQYKDYKKAIGMLVDMMVQDGYAQENELISVTLQSKDERKENQILAAIESTVREHHHTVQLECYSIGGYVAHSAHQVNVSPAKYLAIQELMEVDPTATVESCRNHSIGEIRELTKEHGAHHAAVSETEESVVPEEETSSEEVTSSWNGHHGGHHH